MGHEYDRCDGYDDGNDDDDVDGEYDDDGNTEDQGEILVGTMGREMMMAAQERVPSQKGAVRLPGLTSFWNLTKTGVDDDEWMTTDHWIFTSENFCR